MFCEEQPDKKNIAIVKIVDKAKKKNNTDDIITLEQSMKTIEEQIKKMEEKRKDLDSQIEETKNQIKTIPSKHELKIIDEDKL